MPRHSVSFGQWLQRLGSKRPEAPEYVHAVQPVAVVRDETSLTPPELGRLYAAGGRRTAVASVYTQAVFTTRSRAALVSVRLKFDTAGTALRFQVVEGTPASMTNGVAPTQVSLNEQNPDDPTALWLMGTVAAATLGDTDHNDQIISAATMDMGDWYIPPNHYLIFQVGVASRLMTLSSQWVEFERHNAQ